MNDASSTVNRAPRTDSPTLTTEKKAATILHALFAGRNVLIEGRTYVLATNDRGNDVVALEMQADTYDGSGNIVASRKQLVDPELSLTTFLAMAARMSYDDAFFLNAEPELDAMRRQPSPARSANVSGPSASDDD